MIGGVLHTHQVSVGPSIQICVLTTNVAVAGISGLAVAAEHGVSELSQVVTAGVLVAVVTSVQAGVTWRAHLEGP